MELAALCSPNSSLTTTAIDAVLVEAFRVITDTVAGGGTVRIVGFGTFYSLPPSTRRNMHTGQMCPCPRLAKFKPGHTLKQKMKGL